MTKNLETKSEKYEKKESLNIPTLEELKNFEITKEVIEKYKHTPIDLNFSNRGIITIDKNGKKHVEWIYRKGYKKLFDKVDKSINEPLKSTKDFGILGENYYFRRGTETPQEVINKVFSGSTLKNVSIQVNKNFSEKEYNHLILAIKNFNTINEIKDFLKEKGIILNVEGNDKTFKKRIIIVFKILKSDLKYKKLIEEGLLKNSCYLREGILERLKILNDKLKKVGLQIKIISGYRKQLVQDIARKNFAETNGKGFNLLATKSPHSTGGAFDIELLTYPDGKPLKTKFDNFLSRRQTSSPIYSEKHLPDNNEIKENRRLLYNLMKKFGFIGHYKEYWHFGLGDPLSEYIRAKRSGKDPNKAYVKYGVIEK